MQSVVQGEVARRLFDESHDAYVIYDPRDKRILDVNSVAIQSTGFTESELQARTVADLFNAEDPGSLARLLDAFEKTAQFSSREGCQLLRRDAPPIPVNLSVSRIHTEPHAVGLVVARDVSERIAQDQALRERKERWRTLIEELPALVSAIDGDFNVVVWNRECERVSGYRAAEIINNPRALELLYPDAAYREKMLTEASRRIGSGEPIRDWEWEMTTRDGQRRIIAWSQFPAMPSFEGMQSLGFGIEVSRQKGGRQHDKASREASARYQRLTRREREILRLVVNGEPNKAIASELGISIKTVEMHRANAMRKLNARNTADVVRIALHAIELNEPAGQTT